MDDLSATTLWCVRHGECEHNLVGVQNPVGPGTSLTELGRSQAAAAAATLSGHPVTAVYASPTLRTLETASIIADRFGLPMVTDERLVECSVGECAGRSDPDAVGRCLDLVRSWIVDRDLGARIPGGETGREVVDRCVTALESIAAAASAGGTVVVVSHQVTITAALMALCPELDSATVWGRPLPHAVPVPLTRTGPKWSGPTWPTD